MDIILVHTSSNGATTVLLNTGDGTYDLPNLTPETEQDDGESSVVALGDLNGDGSLDVIFGMAKNVVNTVLLNNADNFAYQTRALPASRNDIIANAIVLATMNGDGILDVVIAKEGEEN